MKLPLLLALGLLAGFAHGQETKSFTLKPIEIAPGPRYFYGGKRLVGGMYGLQVPFFELNDADVLKGFTTARVLNTSASVVLFLPAIYLALSDPLSFRPRSFYAVAIACFGSSLGLIVARNFVIQRTVTLYNQRLPYGSFGLSLQSIPQQPVVPGLGFTVKF